MIEKYAQYLKLKNLSPLTIQNNLSKTKNFLAYLEKSGVNHLADLKQKHLDNYLQQRAYSINAHNRVNRPATRNQEQICLRNFLKFIEREGVLARSIEIPTIRLPMLELPKSILTKTELITLFAQPDLGTVLGYRDRLILELLYATGIRHSEFCNLQINHLNFEEKVVFIKSGKGDKDRMVPCNDTALKFAKNYLAEIRPQLVQTSRQGVSTNHHLILNHHGQPFNNPKLNPIIKQYVLKAKLKKQITIHSFRHTFATHLLQNGMALRHVQELLGHQKLDTTTIYLHLNIKDLQKEYKKFHPQALG